MQTINVLITGANSGLGFELAKQLAADGHGVLMCCRTLAKSNLAKSQILAAFPNAQLWACEMDLSSQESIYQCIEQLPVVADALVCNAAISYDGFHQYTKEGIELTFGVNHLGHFLLVKLLTEKFLALKKILIVASDLHNPEKSKSFFPKPSIEPIKHLAYPAPLSIESLKSAGALRYVNSKLCNVLFTYELARRFAQKQRAGVISAFNPGFMPSTNLSRNAPKPSKWLLRNIFPLFRFFSKSIRTVEQSATDLRQVLFQDIQSGLYFDGAKVVKSSTQSYDTDLAAELWEMSESLIVQSKSYNNS